MTMTPDEFNTAARELSVSFQENFLSNVEKALDSGALDFNSELNYATLKAVLMITAEGYYDNNFTSRNKTLKNLRHFF